MTAGARGGAAGKGRGGDPSALAEVLALDHPDWLYHHLDVTGPEEDLALFRLAAAGPGVIPWMHDWGEDEEDLFLRLMAPPTGSRVLSPHGCRVVAAGLRTALERGDERARAAAARPGGPVPLDLHRLVPVPPAVLRLGPSHPDAPRWLWQHWGTTWPLRHVAHRAGVGKGGAKTRRRGETPAPRLSLAFWSADWTPWPALAAVHRAWPALTLDVGPRYDDG